MSQYDLSKAVGFQRDSEPVAWKKRDLLLYAAGIGSKSTDTRFVYELDERFAAFPTYPVVLALKGDSQDVNVFAERAHERAVPGLPKFNPNRLVHGSEAIEILRPLPLGSGEGWKMTKRIVGVHENKSGIIVDHENILIDASGTAYARLYSSVFTVGAKATGQKIDHSVAAPPAAKPIPKDRKPDWVVTEKTTPEQALVYRLSGDYNPLHIDPAIGNAAGFGGVILHGLCTLGIAARAVLSEVGGNDPNALKFFGVRFTSPVKPGDTLETAIWEIGPVKAADGMTVTEVVFVMTNLTTKKVCLGAGVAYVRKVEKSKM